MEAPPQPPFSASTTSAYPDSVDSSPRSRRTDSWNNHSAPPSKLRLMCSYGGHIVPRPHDKSLCYINGETRIIVLERNTSLSDLHHRLSKTLLSNQPLILRYQLPNEDLDSLISVATDEDLENMVDEYDRLNTHVGLGGLKRKAARLRLFLFPKSPMNIIEHLLETASTKSEEWFLDALNGKKRNLSGSDQGFSDSSSVNSLFLRLNDGFGSNVRKDVEASKNNGGNGNGSSIVVNNDAHSSPDSPMLETTSSSFGSTSSSPPSVLENSLPIKVRVEENLKLGIEEQLQQMSVGVVENTVDLPVVQKQEGVVGGFVAAAPVVVVGEYANRAVSDDRTSAHGGYSEGSVMNQLYRRKQTIYQEPYTQIQSGNVPVTTNQVDLRSGNQDIRNNVQVQESSYVLSSSHYDQNHPQLHQPQQFIHQNTQYIPDGSVPITQYYQIYPPRQQSVHEQQYSVYFMPTRQTQAYNLPSQQPSAHNSRPQTPPSACTQGRITPSSNPEMPAGVYRAGAPQYVGLPQFHHPSQSVAPSSVSNPPFNNYEFADPTQLQIYYTQALPPQMAAQYQTLTSASPESFGQPPSKNMKQAS